MKIFLAIFLTLLVLAVAAVGFIYSGLYDVAATKPHNPVVRWALETMRQRSVAVRSGAVGSPDITAAALAEEGARHYRETCESCHGGPGVEPTALGKGLRPRPPDLSKGAAQIPPEDVFWIVKHGIKMTGMPAWGPTHEDRELWAIVAFVKRLPQLSPAEYQALGR